MSAVGKDGKYGFINKKGETIIPFVFDYAESFNGESTIASKGDKSVIINKEGKIVKEFESGYLRDFSEGLAIYEKDENDELRYGYVDEKGNLIIPRKFYSVRGIYGIFEDGFASVYKYAEGKFGVIDKSGKEVLPFKFESDILYSEELFLVYNNGKAGYYDTNGKCVIPCEYETATPFYEGLAAVEKGGLWGFIDKSGKMVINPVFDDVNSFSDGLAVVKKNDKYGIVDKNGKSTFSPQELEKLNIQKEETIEKEEEQYEEESMEYEEESNSKQVDITPILYECQNEITAIQREIEEACRTFVVLGSQDVDMYKYTQMKSTFLDGVSDLERQADRAFDKCARELKEAGYPDAVDKIINAKQIQIFGVGTAGLAAYDLYCKLLRIHYNVVFNQDQHLSLMTVSQIGPADVAIFFSDNARNKQIMQLFTAAKDAGATTVAITKLGNNALTTRCDYVLFATSPEIDKKSGITSSRFAQLFLVDTLYTAIANRDYDNIEKYLALSYEIFSEPQWE